MRVVRFIRRLVVGLVLLYVAVVATIGATDIAKPAFRGLAVSWCVLLWLASRQHPNGQPRNVHWLEIVATNIALALLFGEVSLRLYAHATGNLYWVANTLEAHRLIPGHDYGNGLRGNCLGYPGPDPPPRTSGVMRIAALGDSFAVGCGVPFTSNYLSQVERLMGNAQVLNFGVSGSGPREYLAVLNDDVLETAPDLVLVNVFVGNDITEQLPTQRGLDIRGHALWCVAERLLHLGEEHRRHVVQGSTFTMNGALAEETFRAIEARRLQVCVQPTSKEMARKWQRCLGFLDAIIQRCQQQRIRVAVVLIPDEFQVNDAVLRQALHDAKLTRTQVDLSGPQRRLQSFCMERNLPCLDLLPVLRAHAGCYLERDTHWNERGHRVAAEAIAAWLLQR